jgi:alkylation response protein AidB-like acyl-CoA dehydrogenase
MSAADFGAAVRAGDLALPPPGGGRTAERLLALADWARRDLVLARLAEGHADARAILAELGEPAGVGGETVPWGVWAAVPRSVSATLGADGWWLDGERPWSSGAAVCEWALVTAAAPDGIGLFAVDLSRPGVSRVDGSWPAVGMAGSDSRTVRFGRVAALPVGGPGEYVGRPGFWHGGIGVAACWYGGAAGVADALVRAARERSIGPHALAHLGAVDAALGAARTVLLDAATRIDADPKAPAERLARQVRATVEATATTVLDHVGRALGAGPLCRDAEHGRRVADLTVYIRQSHAETDLEALGALAAEPGASGW